MSLGNNILFLRWNVLLTLVCLCSVLDGRLTRKPANTEVVVGNRVRLSCSTSEPFSVLWRHCEVGSNTCKHVFSGAILYLPYSKRFRMEIDNATGRYDLLMPSVQKEDAGSYRCTDMAGQGEEAVVDLVVLDTAPVCESRDVQFCKDTKTNTETTCAVSYVGNIIPEVECSGAGVSTFNSAVTDQSQNKVTYLLKLEVLWSTDNTLSYACRTKISHIPSDLTRPQITYAFDVNAVIQTESTKATCAANYSNGIECSYEWLNATNTSVAKGRNLTALASGKYYCTATCPLQRSTCKLSSNPVQLTLNEGLHGEASGETPYSLTAIIGIALGLTLLSAAIVSIVVIVLLSRRRRQRARSQSSVPQDQHPTATNHNGFQENETGVSNGKTNGQHISLLKKNGTAATNGDTRHSQLKANCV